MTKQATIDFTPPLSPLAPPPPVDKAIAVLLEGKGGFTPQPNHSETKSLHHQC